MLRKSAMTILLALFLFAMIGAAFTLDYGPQTGNKTTTIISSQRDPGPDETVTDKPINNMNFNNQWYYWSFYKYGQNPSSVQRGWDGGGYQASYGVWAYIYGTSKRGTGEWNQSFVYSGEPQVNSSYLTFRWRCSTFSQATGGTYTVRVVLTTPTKAKVNMGSPVSITGTTSWQATPVRFDTNNTMNTYGPGTYAISLNFTGSTPSSGSPYVVVYWDDVGLAVTYKPKLPPSNLDLRINGNASYSNSRIVNLRPKGDAILKVGLSNTKSSDAATYTWLDAIDNVTWDLGNNIEGPHTVYFVANNTKGSTLVTPGPVNDTVICDYHAPSTANPFSISDGSATNTRTPTLVWISSTDTGPAGMLGYVLQVSFNDPTFTSSADNRTWGSFTDPALRCNSSSWTITPSLPDGLWYWRVYSVDNANNTAVSTVWNFTIDLVPPNKPVPQVLIGNYPTRNQYPTFSWADQGDPGDMASGIANYSLEYSKDVNFDPLSTTFLHGLIPTSYTAPSALTEGTWYWRVSALDRAGNMNSLPSIVGVFVVDITPPAIIAAGSMSPQVGSSIGDKPTFRWGTVTDGVSYIIQVDTSSSFSNPKINQSTTQTQYVDPDSLAEGTWYWRVRVVDAAGNVGSWSQTVSFTVTKPLDPLMVTLAGGGTGGAAILLVLGYYFVRKARIPFVIKKIDQSIKMISKGEMPQPVPMRTRTQLVKSIFETKLAIMSKEKLEETEGKKTVSREAVISPEKLAPQGLPKGAEAPAKAEAEESDVDLVAKELEKLEAREEKRPSDETELIKREIEELEKGSKKKRKSESG